MNDSDLGLALERLVTERKRVGPPPALQQAVWAIPDTTPGERGWLPRIDTGGFDMFSALKFGAAGVIVALFGGFLLAGVLTTQQGDEVLPATVTESPSPPTTEELLSGMVTEEVEPGVFHVLNDGVRRTGRQAGRIVAGHDGGIWFLSWTSGGFFRLGDDKTHEHKLGRVEDFEVAADGTVWEIARPADGGLSRLLSYDGERWTRSRPMEGRILIHSVDIAPDGTPWATWSEGPGWSPTHVGSMGSDGWERLGTVPDDVGPAQVILTGAGDLIVLSTSPAEPAPVRARRYVEGTWHDVMDGFGVATISADGAIWLLPQDEVLKGEEDDYLSNGTLVRYEGGERREWGPDERVPVFHFHYRWPHDLEVAPDGSLWVTNTLRPEPDGPPDCEGVARFDGESWDRFLTSHCLMDMEIASDGTVWVNGWIQDDAGNRGSPDNTYVIHPVAAATGE